MTLVYSSTAIDDRLQGTVTAIDSGGAAANLKLYAGVNLVSTIQLLFPCGAVANEVLTFFPGVIDPAAAGTGSVTNATIENSAGDVIVSGLTVGAPGSASDIIITNGLNSTLITAGQAVQLISGQIIGGP